MNKEQRAALRKLAEGATPGPWLVNGKQSVRGDNREYIAKTNWLNGANNANYIATADPSTILQLLDYIETLEGALQNAKDTFECLCGENSTERLMCNDAVRVINAAMEG